MTSKTTSIAAIPASQGGVLGRTLALLYGLASYAFFFVTFLYAVGFVANLVVPQTIDIGPAAPLSEALVVNTLLIALFAIQHSVMARPAFKASWTQYVPKAIERSTYVLFATACLALLLWQWRPIPDVFWQVENSARLRPSAYFRAIAT
jgi:methanethiol S-methyltransferase